MPGDGIFALLSRGASLHKCKDSLATPFFRRTAVIASQQQTPSSLPVVSSEVELALSGGPSDKRGTQITSETTGAERATQLRQRHSIFVSGEGDIPCPFESFDDEVCPAQCEVKGDQLHAGTSTNGQIDGGGERRRKLPVWLIARLQRLGFSSPTAIQMQALPLLLNGEHILATAPTGSGKTLAFLLPFIAALKAPRPAEGRLIVLSPTRELAKQTLRVFELLTDGIGFKAVFPQSHTGGSYGTSDAIFATPLSLVKLVEQSKISIAGCRFLVLDEADRLLDRGSGRASAAAPSIEQELLFCSTEAGKLWALRSLRTERKLVPPCLIFVETQDRAGELLREMLSTGFSAAALHAAKSKAERDKTVEDFRTGKIWFLICTDLVARGVDFKGVALVINFDLPLSTSVYIHRIGRTGRACREGKALTFFTLDDVPRLRPIVQVMRKSSNSKIPAFLRTKLTRNLRVKGSKKVLGKREDRRRRMRKPINPISKFDLMRKRRRAQAVAASKERLRNRVETGSTAIENRRPKSGCTGESGDGTIKTSSCVTERSVRRVLPVTRSKGCSIRGGDHKH